MNQPYCKQFMKRNPSNRNLFNRSTTKEKKGITPKTPPIRLKKSHHAKSPRLGLPVLK